MKNLAGNRVIVTGGAGLNGTFLCMKLIDASHDVLSVDNYFTGAPKQPGTPVEQRTLRVNRPDIIFFLYLKVDEICNLPLPASPAHYHFDPVQTRKTSVHGTINMPGLAKQAASFSRPPRARSMAIRASIPARVLLGQRQPDRMARMLRRGKRCAETLCFDYHRQHKVRIKTVRIFNTYGPRMHPNDPRVVSNVILQALLGRDITVMAMELRRAPSAMSTISSTRSSGSWIRETT
jgi:UDP-glucuronate decarboxylase